MFLFVVVDKIDNRSTANVVVFTPPAVEPEEPPINIKIVDNVIEGSDNIAWLVIAKPAVLQVVAWKKAANNLPPKLYSP